MQDRTPPRASGAGFGVIVVALAVTAGIGALVKQRERHSLDRDPTRINDDVTVEVLETGTGTPNVGGSPPSTGWAKFVLHEEGRVVKHRPIRFDREGRDRQGRFVRTDQVWSNGLCYLVVRAGYANREAPVEVTLRDHGREIGRVTVPTLAPSRREIDASPPVPKDLQVRFVPIKSRIQGEDELGAEIRAHLRDDEILVLGHTGSTYQPANQRRPSLIAQLGTQPARVVPLDLDYPEEAQAIALELTRYRAVSVTRDVTLPLRYISSTESARFYSPVPIDAAVTPNVHVAFSRTNRFLSAPRLRDSFIALLLSSTATLAWCRTTVLNPGRIYEARVILLNQMEVAEGSERSVAAVESQSVATPTTGDVVNFRVRVNAGVYQVVDHRTVIVPVKGRLSTPPVSRPVVQKFAESG